MVLGISNALKFNSSMGCCGSNKKSSKNKVQQASKPSTPIDQKITQQVNLQNGIAYSKPKKSNPYAVHPQFKYM